MVRQWQTLIYDHRYSQTTLDRGPDFVKLAEAYGLGGAHGTGRIPHRGRSGSDTVLTLVATISIAAVVVIGFWTLILPSLANRKPAGPSPSIRQESSSSTSTSDATSNDTTTADTTSGSDETGSSEPVAKAVYILPDSDSRYYSASELAGLTDEQLVLARNEIYARHAPIACT